MPRSKKSPLPRREGQGEGFPTVALIMRSEVSSKQLSVKPWRAFILGMAFVTALGCANHPPLERPSYDLAKALYAVCNRQSTEHLAKFDEVLTKAIAAGEVGPQEESALREIAQEAAAGEWYDAQEMARELIAGQNS
jgi:hypothetical protein